MIDVPRERIGREIDLGEVAVTGDMIVAYTQAVGDEVWFARDADEAPPTFCLTMRRGMTPEVVLPPGFFGVYGGHDLEFHQPIRAGHRYRVSARICDVFEKSGRSGALTVVVREGLIRNQAGELMVRITEQEIIRRRPEPGV